MKGGGSKAKTRGWSTGLGLAGSRAAKDNLSLGVSTGFNLCGGLGQPVGVTRHDVQPAQPPEGLDDAGDPPRCAASAPRSDERAPGRDVLRAIKRPWPTTTFTIQYFEDPSGTSSSSRSWWTSRFSFRPVMMSRFTDGRIRSRLASEHLLYGPDTATGQELRRGLRCPQSHLPQTSGRGFPQRREGQRHGDVPALLRGVHR